MNFDEYKLTHTRPTDELESDDSATPTTKRVMLYGWDGTNKVRLACDATGALKFATEALAFNDLSDMPGGAITVGNITTPGSVLASTGTLTLGGTGGTHNENLTLDFETAGAAQEVLLNTGTNAQIESSVRLDFVDNIPLVFGSGNDAFFYFRDKTNDYFQLGLGTGSTSNSGYFSIMQTGDLDSANRDPGGFSTNPVLRIYSSDATETGDYIEFFHNQTDAYIQSGSGTINLNDDNLTTTGSGTFGGTQTGQSSIDAGLVVNSLGGGAAADDFRAETDNEVNALVVDASADEILINVPTQFADDNDKLTFGVGKDGEIFSSGDDFNIKNITSDADLILGINDGGAAKTITWDADVDMLKHSAGAFNFHDDNLYTTGYMIGGTVGTDEAIIGLDANTAGHQGISIAMIGGEGYLTAVHAGAAWKKLNIRALDIGFDIGGSADQVTMGTGGTFTTVGKITGTVSGVAVEGQNTTDSSSVQVAIWKSGNRVTAANNDEGYFSFCNDDSNENQAEFARFTWKVKDVTSNSKDARVIICAQKANSLTEIACFDHTVSQINSTLTIPSGASVCAGGTSYCGSIGDLGSYGGYFCDGTRYACLGTSSQAGYFYYATNYPEVELACSSYGIHACKGSTGSAAACFYDGTRTAVFTDGSYGGCVYDGTYTAEFANGSYSGVFCTSTTYACLADSNAAGQFCYSSGSNYCACLGTSSCAACFYDGGRCVEIANGSCAACFNDGTYYVCIVDGSQAGCFYYSMSGYCIVLATSSYPFCAYDGSMYYTYMDTSVGLCAGCYINTDACFCCSGTAGVSTTFTNGDGATVTVSGGIITSIV